MSEKKHPMLDYPEQERIDYLTIVASMAIADGEVTDEEISLLRDLCKKLEIGAKGMGIVISAAEDPSSAPIEKTIDRLSSSDLRFTLMADVIFLAYADDIIVSGEEEEINKIAKKLNLNIEQVISIRKYVEAVRKAVDADGSIREDLKKLGGDVASSLAATGVPIVAVAVSGSVFGLSAAGITSGLAALGLGLGMVPGIGTAVAIGIGTFFSVRWLYKKIVGA